jgi:adenine-specific DNA methylase
MAGTSSVAYFFKTKGYRVAANDYLRCNYFTAVALVENGDVLLGERDLEFILSNSRTLARYQVVQRNFSGFFYTDEENRWFDQRIAKIDRLEDLYHGRELRYKRALAYHVLFQVALMKRPFNLFHRKNLSLRQADVERSFGNKTTWDTPCSDLYYRLADTTNSAVHSNDKRNHAYNRRAEALLTRPSYDVIYIDPPYFARGRERTRSDYRFLYHFLEGMARYHEWESLIDRDDMRHALARDYRGKGPLAVPESALARTMLNWLDSIIRRWPGSAIILSYKSPGLPSTRQLRDLLKQHRQEVKVYKRPYTYALSKMNGQPKENIEVLMIAE